MLKTLLTLTGYLLIAGSIIGTLWSIPNYLGNDQSHLLFLIFSMLLQSLKVIGIGLLCLFAGRYLEKNHD